MTKKLKEQELFLQNKIEARQIGIRSRFTAFLMYRNDKMAREQAEITKGRTYRHKDLITI